MTALFVAHRNRLEMLAARRSGQREHARDLVQDAFTRLLATGSSGTVEQDTRMLYAIARNATIDSGRSVRRRAAALAGLAPEQVLTQSPSPADILDARDLLQQVDAILRKLPPRTRDVFILRRVHGLSYAEIAGTLGVSLSTVEKHLLRAIRACAPLMLRDGGTGAPPTTPDEDSAPSAVSSEGRRI